MIRTCVVCGKTFETTFSRHVYCSKECRDFQRNADRREKRREETRIRQNTPVTCPVCRKKFLSKYGKKYCSYKCARKAQRRKDCERRGIKRHVGNKVKCPTCGKMFVLDMSSRKYCSHECQYAMERKMAEKYRKQRETWARQRVRRENKEIAAEEKRMAEERKLKNRKITRTLKAEHIQDLHDQGTTYAEQQMLKTKSMIEPVRTVL